MVAARGERAGHPGVDEWLEADLEFPGGATGSARCNMAGDGVHMPCRIVGDRGEAVAANFALPTMDDRVTITTQGGRRVERLGTRPTYTYQLEALRAHLRDGARCPSTPTTPLPPWSCSTPATAPPASSPARTSS